MAINLLLISGDNHFQSRTLDRNPNTQAEIIGSLGLMLGSSGIRPKIAPRLMIKWNNKWEQGQYNN
jgi:hypothetical protein